MSAGVKSVKSKSAVSLSDLRLLSQSEFERRAEKLKLVEDELHYKTIIRDIELSVRISVDNTERVCIGSSAAMLCLVSEYFSAMFEGDVIERGETIELSDKITLAGMRAINALAFGALSKVQVNGDILAQLMTAAQYCKVPSLTELCNEYIIHNDVFNDIEVIAQLMTDLNHLGFTQQADEWMERVPSQAIARLFLAKSTLRMSFDLFSNILSSDCLCMSEEEIWLRCVEWAVSQATMYDDDVLVYLTDLKPMIRFTLMSEEFLMKNVFKTNLLTMEEFATISAVKYGAMDASSLFCPVKVRKPPVDITDYRFDETDLMQECQCIREDGAVLSHFGKNNWATAFVTGPITKGTREIEFIQLTDYHSFYGVLEASEKPKLGETIGYPSRGCALYGGNGNLNSPYKQQPFGDRISEGDRVRIVVKFQDESNAIMLFYRNGMKNGVMVKLDKFFKVSNGVRIVVQTYYKGSEIRIKPKF